MHTPQPTVINPSIKKSLSVVSIRKLRLYLTLRRRDNLPSPAFKTVRAAKPSNDCPGQQTREGPRDSQRCKEYGEAFACGTLVDFLHNRDHSVKHTNFVALIPTTHNVKDTWQETSLKGAQKEATSENGAFVLPKRHAYKNRTPRRRKTGNIPGRLDVWNEHIARHFEDEICDKEYSD